MSLPPSITALASRTAEFGALLEQWANVNSGSGHAAGLARMLAALREEFIRAFPAATCETLAADAAGFNPPGAQALRLRLRPAAPTQIFLCGHYDTVYEADDAFQICRWADPHTLHGPGVTDMKGGLVTLLAALEAFEQTAHAANLGWEVLLTPDEETGSHGTRQLLEDAARRCHFGLVFEPARPNGDIIHSRKGTGGVVATCHGRAAHAAKTPNDGRNAILGLAEFLLAAAKIPAELPGVLVNVGNIRGGSAATNVVPHRASAEIDIRITRAPDLPALWGRLHAIAFDVHETTGMKIELTGGLNRPPKECLPAEEVLFPEWQRAARDVGVAPFTWVHGGGASDGNFLTAAGLPNLDGLGPIGDQLHSDREHCRVDTLAPRAQIAALVLHRLASGEITLPQK
ncbi:MAG: hydrolase [Candidatus Didemnitutus sp.]|nr:hydrolase [Candidatus Didemnitutus sp.]